MIKIERELENLYENLTPGEREFIYRKVLYNYIKEDTIQYIEDNFNDIKDIEGTAETVAERWVNEGRTDATLSHWDNIRNLITTI